MINGELVDVPIVVVGGDEGRGKADDFPGEKGGVLGPGFEQRSENTVPLEDGDV